MTQREVIENIKKRTGIVTDTTLALFLGIAEKGALARMKRNQGGASIHSLCEVISLLLDGMTEAQRQFCIAGILLTKNGNKVDRRTLRKIIKNLSKQ